MQVRNPMFGIYLLVFDNLVVTFQIYYIFVVNLSPQGLLGNLIVLIIYLLGSAKTD